ncbi:transmembrane amino acid transporter protein-domain-containing protein [Crassisporium funariophilum]|nr:transmembrane amino acid transporter protein-domain-containing protein [Crassisporium funariophilum]
MASFSTSFIGSASSVSARSVRDAIQSYRRAQYLVAGSTVASASESDLGPQEDEEAQSVHDYFTEDSVDDDEVEGITPTATRPRNDSFVGQLDWDEDYDAERPGLRREQDTASTHVERFTHIPRHSPRTLLAPPILQTPREDTPLLHKKISFSATPPVRRNVIESPKNDSYNLQPELGLYLTPPPPVQRRLSSTSAASAKGVRYNFRGKSTFGQTLFNSIAILLGIGMLSEPLAFAYSGWAVGTFLIMSYGLVACYTAKILARIILPDPRLRSYSDIGRKAFGPGATPIISLMFCLELFAVSVILVTLYGDSLHSLLPQNPSSTYKVWGLFLLIPTVFLPLSLLSYTSILGIISTILLVFVIFIDGFSKPDAPGSLWSAAETNFGVKSYNKLGIAFGLFMAGFSGHAVIPSLARDMIDPTRFDEMINWAFVVATCIYTIIGYAGYIMFGNHVSDEVSMDLLKTPGYNPALNTFCLWLLVLSPLSKFALNTQPLNATLEIVLGIDTPLSSPEDLAAKPDGLSVAPEGSRFGWRRVLAIIQRVFLTTLAVAVSIWVPEFSSMMAFLGSFSAFMLSIVGPVMAKVMINRQCNALDGMIIVVGIVMAVWGTSAAFLST